MFDKTRHDWYPTVQRGDITFQANRVISSDGRLRPALATVDVFTVHYIGAGSNWLDHDDTADELAGIERNHAIPTNRPNEYNSASDSQGVTWEWAGRFRAAHTGGHNSTAWGHLAVIGLEEPTEAQAAQLIAGIRRARTQLVAAGALTRDHRVIAHRDMPRASTPCPGRLRTNPDWWARIAAPLPSAPDPEEMAMLIVNRQTPHNDDGTPNVDWVATMSDGPFTSHLHRGDTYLRLRTLGVKEITLDDAEFDGWLRSTSTTTPAPSNLPQNLRALWEARRA